MWRFLINGYQDISEITIFKTNFEVEQSSSKIKDWNTLQKKGENVTKLFIEYDHIPWSDVMQVCLNGHLINTSYSKYPDNNEDYCSQCGAETIIGCPKCKKKFRGDQYRPTYEKKGQIKNFC